MRDPGTDTRHDLERWHCGDRDALEALIARNFPWIQAQVRRRLGSGLRRMMDSMDVVQEAAIEFLKYGPRFVTADEARFRALLARIVENVLRGEHDRFTARRRDMARQRPLPSDTRLDLDAPGRSRQDTPSQAAERREQEAWIRLGMELLRPDDRDVLVLRQWDGLPFDEIAKRLSLTEHAAWMRHNRAVVRLGRKVAALRSGALRAALAADPGEEAAHSGA